MQEVPQHLGALSQCGICSDSIQTAELAVARTSLLLSSPLLSSLEPTFKLVFTSYFKILIVTNAFLF